MQGVDGILEQVEGLSGESVTQKNWGVFNGAIVYQGMRLRERLSGLGGAGRGVNCGQSNRRKGLQGR